MAKIKINFPGGRISGKLNGLVYKVRNGKNYVSAPPVRTTKPSEYEILRRNNFGVTAKLASKLSKAAHAEEIWNKHKRKNQTVFNAIFKNVYDLVVNKIISDDVHIYPHIFGFDIPDDSVKYEDNVLKASFDYDELKSHLQCMLEYIQMSVVIVCRQPVMDNLPETAIINWNSKPVTPQPDGSFRFTLSLSENDSCIPVLSDQEKEIITNYEVCNVFAAFVALDKEEEYLVHSDTVSFINIK